MNNAKIAFMSSEYVQIGRLNSYLTKKHKINTEMDSYIGYPVIKVAQEDYVRALMIGSMFAINKQFNDICWVSPSDSRMHNMDDLAIESRACLKMSMRLPKKVIEKLEEQQYSSQQEIIPEEFEI